MHFGLLNIDKPKEMTSRKAVDHVAKLAKPSKAGHAGTLDPLASGVLIVCVGPATRLIPDIQAMRKTYRGSFRLGLTSNTDDITGDVQPIETNRAVTRDELQALLKNFIGQIEQVPPKFSAVHIDGKRAYDLARRGREVTLVAKTVSVYRLELTDFSYPDFSLEIECGSGTYIRSIGRDLGEMLKCGAVMKELERTQIGQFSVSESVSIESLTSSSLDEFMIPAVHAVANLPRYRCRTEDLQLLGNGRPLEIDRDRFQYPDDAATLADGSRVAILGVDEDLAAIGQLDQNETVIAPKQVFLRPN